MKCSKVQRLLLSSDPADLAGPIRDHLAQCPACARQHDQVCHLVGLVGLKRYESPGPKSVDQCIAQVRRQIAWIRWNADQQESGRAGRDGLEAECLLLFSSGDFGTWKRIIELNPVFFKNL